MDDQQSSCQSFYPIQEYGSSTRGLEAEIGRAKAKCPEAHYVGIADGAKGNWEFLRRHTDVQVTDFWHAAEYLGQAAVVLYRGQPQTRKAWLDDACDRLKHDSGYRPDFCENIR
jgi:hypothetical protein